MLGFGERICEDQPEVQTDFENEECRFLCPIPESTSQAVLPDSPRTVTPRMIKILWILRRLKAEEEEEPGPEPAYLATSPNGTTVHIPKELFVALSDFMQTRKCPGSITIQFRKGEIVCVEAVAKKTYRRP